MRAFWAAICLTLSTTCWARSEALTPEPSEDSYNFAAHYRVAIDAPVADVWPVLLDLRSWMYEFDLATVSGEPGQEGHVLRLYPGQEFYIQVSAVFPEEMLTIVNLPATFQDERMTGTAVLTLHETGSGTEVALTMSRRHTWEGEGDNPGRAVRDSAAFQNQTRAMWRDRLLTRLKALAEGDVTDAEQTLNSPSSD